MSPTTPPGPKLIPEGTNLPFLCSSVDMLKMAERDTADPLVDPEWVSRGHLMHLGLTINMIGVAKLNRFRYYEVC